MNYAEETTMKKMALLTITAFLVACSNPITTSQPQPVSGVFKGTLPCADCEKIEAELTLNDDSTYEYYTVYHKNGKEHPFTDKGNYSWDKKRKNVIRLENSENLAIQINETHAELCGPDGKPAEGTSNYQLKKIAQ